MSENQKPTVEQTSATEQMNDPLMEETRQILNRAAALLEETARMIHEEKPKMNELREFIDRVSATVDKQSTEIGRIHNSYGEVFEIGSASSIRRILKEINDTVEFPRDKNKPQHINGKNFDADLIGVSDNAIYLVEQKVRINDRGVRQLLRNLNKFPQFYPEFSHLELFGVVAAGIISEDMHERLHAEGLYTITFGDGLFTLQQLEGFEPKSFNEVVAHERNLPNLKIVK